MVIFNSFLYVYQAGQCGKKSVSIHRSWGIPHGIFCFFGGDPMDKSTETCMAQSHIKDLENYIGTFSGWIFFYESKFNDGKTRNRHREIFHSFGGSSLDTPSMA